MNLIFVVTLLSLGCVKGQFFEDRRCRCVCPSPALVLNSTNTRQIYTGNVPPNKCDCEGVVLPVIKGELEGKLHIFCPRCECVYQTRNTSLIMATVFLILLTISMLILYLASFLWLQMLLRLFRRSDDEPQVAIPPEVDFVREHRGEFAREREREREREKRRRSLERKRRAYAAVLESDEEALLEWDSEN